MRKVESPKELREICQRPPAASLAKVIWRRGSIYLTWILLHTPVDGIHVTVAWIFLGVAGAALLGLGSHWIPVAGALLLVLQHLLDVVDGEITRYKKSESAVGMFLDKLGHNIVYPTIFLGLGFATYRTYPIAAVFVFSFTAAISKLLMQNSGEVLGHVLRQWAERSGDRDAPVRARSTDKRPKSRYSLIRIARHLHLPFLYTKGIDLVILATALAGRLDIALFFYGATMPIRAFFALLNCFRHMASVSDRRKELNPQSE